LALICLVFAADMRREFAMVHETLLTEKVRASSDRSFGLVFAAVSALWALYPLLQGGLVRTWAAILSAGFFSAALFFPRALHPLNLAWLQLGLLLQKLVHPLVMALLFFGILTPLAFLLRAMGKDSLRRKFEPELKSYWIERKPAGEQDSMRDQF
jgi:hypothetical protein